MAEDDDVLAGVDEVMGVGLELLPVLRDGREHVVDHRVGATEDPERLRISLKLMPLSRLMSP